MTSVEGDGGGYEETYNFVHPLPVAVFDMLTNFFRQFVALVTKSFKKDNSIITLSTDRNKIENETSDYLLWNFKDNYRSSNNIKRFVCFVRGNSPNKNVPKRGKSSYEAGAELSQP